jgi:signal transduction histidine kinase/CheY-like chemotaxis protein
MRFNPTEEKGPGNRRGPCDKSLLPEAKAAANPKACNPAHHSSLVLLSPSLPPRPDSPDPSQGWARFAPQTIGSRLVAAIGLASALVIGGVSYTAFRASRTALIAQMNAEGFTEVQTAATGIDEAVNRLAYVPRMLAAYQAGVGREPKPQLEFIIRNLLRRIPAREIYGTYIAFDAKPWYDPAGMIWMDRTSWPVLRRVDYDYHDPKQDWYDGVKQTRRLHITEPYFDDTGSATTMVGITFPVILDGDFIGVSGVDIPVKEITDLMSAIHRRAADRHGGEANANGYIYLASRAGRLMVHPDASLTVRDGFAGVALDTLPQGSRLVGEKEGTARYLAADGERILYWTVTNDTGWKVVLDQSAAVVMAPIHALEWRTGAIGGGGLLVLLALVGLISRRATRPVVKLERAARALQTGAFDPAELDHLVARHDESGRLARAFQGMAREIRAREASQAEWNRNLERTVAERTADLVAAREAAEEASRTKSTFLANMSHELRTPMNAIIGYSEMLIEEAEDLGQPGFVPDLRKINGAGKHLLGLINDILDISKIEAGKMTLYLEEFAVSAMVAEVGATIRPLVEKNGNQLAIECPADLGPMRADVTKVRQTLFNLLSNAAKFTHDGRISLMVAPAERGGARCLAFSVADTGIGMTPEQMGKLFQAFVQADASTTRKYGGTGLGLAISRRFCVLMGGDITVASEPGRGTVFTAVIPVRVREDAGADPAAAAPAAGPGGSAPEMPGPAAPLILVVDDDPTVVDLLSRSLMREGYRVRTSLDGRDALALARDLRPRLITLDVMMPSMDGWSVLAALKADPATHDIPVVMASIVDDKQMGYSLGAAEYLTKPIDRDRLSTILARHAPHAIGRLALVIDDLPDNREVLRWTLEGQGWQVIEAEHGRSGLEQFEARHPSLILLDLAMPVMDGFEFLRELRHRPAGRTVPVVVVTAKELTPEERNLLRACVEQVVQKGAIGPETLIDEIRAQVAAASRDGGEAAL